jgi:predicted glycosyltransferase
VPTKLLFYAHNGRGLGHFSRLSKIGRLLQSEVGDLSILFLTQCSMAHGFDLPAGSDVVRIPGVLPDETGPWVKALPLAFEDVHEVRRQVMLATSLAYRPDLFLVDHSPAGVLGDLLPALRALDELPERPTIVCGLLDMVGPEAIRRKWEATGAMRALDEIYDEIWVYGCREFFDVAERYGMPESVARKVRYCGYIGVDTPTRSREEIRKELGVENRKLVAVTVGGMGLDGSDLLDLYLDALERLPLDAGVLSLLVTGPEAPADVVGAIRARCDRVASERPRSREFRVREFVPGLAAYLKAADAVLTRGGYNTVTEAVSLGVRPVVVPLAQANTEQRLRAEIFEQIGLLRLPDPRRPAPEALAAALAETLDASLEERVPHDARVDFGGLRRIRDNYLRLMESRRREAVTGRG